ncbi:MAG: hypothetical protein ACFFCV_17295 [Promethearchaeota archaeon]
MCLSNCFKDYPILKELHVYIDCNNVAYSQFNQYQVPLLSDIISLLHYLTKELGFSEENIHCICDPSLRYYIDKPVEFEVLVKEGKIVEAPKIADEFILSFALKHDFCFIISNDKFRDYLCQLPSNQWLEERRVTFMIIDSEVCLSPNINYEKIEKIGSNIFCLNRRSPSSNITTVDVVNRMKKTTGELELF